MAKVSILIPAHNYAHYLGGCLQSVLNQTDFSDFEVILVDDASTDETPALLTRVSDSRVRCLRNATNQGHIRTMNRAFSEARGSYFVRLDADDRWYPQFLSRTVPILDSRPHVGLVHTGYSLMGADDVVTADRASNVNFIPDGFEGNELIHLIYDNYFPPNGVLFRRECLQAIGGEYPERFPYAEDWNLWLQAGKKWHFHFIEEPLVYYRRHEANLHERLNRAGIKERCEIEILSDFFSDTRLPSEIGQLKNEVFAARYRHLAQMYVNRKMPRDGLRCLARSLYWQPSGAANRDFWKTFTSGTLPRFYRALRLLKRQKTL